MISKLIIQPLILLDVCTFVRDSFLLCVLSLVSIQKPNWGWSMFNGGADAQCPGFC
jgi:hypothetical protein